ncbi:nucleoside triphosphate pyrophosphohydrolase [Rodentibacter pneumotropicus]|uniref:nucleoside triphosphate pyrophosphohydrolase n=1 Tax=Rodentibacter pneumotropicus TaxID=758 RepID=UPI00035C7C25|nr:nucleoside triphosphate pyrophosphohydrolase [Rodentibacter pneumotropicus]NBH75660.1 nucleoside triphosphate pyrophosphohydrolase [Rodentibacter pneumotropicus]OOF61163.1 nucleoside triphosphate pyrophosphohydrolase [Rodentibacter pneumotropicus]THA04239.1 nucleoside triphosphate pyrophosphohydrolase [Rodentibacter pneumotropicus]THA06069.1 nucleoside triphosphate pyrophosphohydrolase [Rodentibacter pneumotropicus]THA13586.1 nucleoside triphosphate pyrophosphohydrolase [Rodentibacter pneum
MPHSIQDFIALIAQLRHPDKGCPWDLKQNYESMIPCLIEETYEVIDAIQKKDVTNLREELGDLLLQVVFFSQLASEDNYFNFDDVLNDVAEKIIRRHPHVFADAKAENEEEALVRWNSIKALEKSKVQNQSILDNVPSAFPALMRAQKLQKHCAKIGFDWREIEPVFAKVEEELQEVKDEFNKNTQNIERIEEELGDLFFATVNLSRHLKCNAEESLRKANTKFEQRFRKVEQKAKEIGKELTALSLIEMDILWDEVKREEKIAS